MRRLAVSLVALFLAGFFPTYLQAQELGAPIVPDQPPETSLSAGGTFYLLKPFQQNNTAYVATIDPGQPNSRVSSEPFHWHSQPAYAGWIGWSNGNGLGVRARYFQFVDSSETETLLNGVTPAPGTQTTINPPLANFLPLSTGGTAFGSPGTVLNTGLGADHLTFASDLRIHAIDLEFTYQLNCAYGSVLLFGGGRYLDLEQNYRATLVNSAAGISETQVFDSSRSFHGGGPTLGLEWNIPICRTGLSFYGNARGSLLVGTNKENVSFTQTINDPNGLIPGHIVPPAILQINPTSSRNSDNVLPVTEVELGLEYGRRVGRTWLFVRGAAVSQVYFDAGNASQSSGNLSLFGVQGSVGLKY